MYLLDTNIISETRRQRPHGAVMGWLAAAHPATLRISAISAGEIQSGIELTRRRDTAKAHELDEWLDEVLNRYEVISMDARTFRVWSKLKLGRSQTLYDDAMIAAAAIVHQLTIVTRNVRDFESFDVPTFDPFSA